MAGPVPGTIEDGYIFVGGDPGKQSSWRPVQTPDRQEAAALADMREAANRTQNFSNMAQQFMALNRQTGTGPGRVFGLGELLPSKTSANLQAMQSIASRAAPSMRVPGSGATSDKDMALYLASFPKITNWGGSNQQIARELAKDAERSAARAAYNEKWVQTTGSLDGADAAFERWWANRQAGGAKRPAPVSAPPRPKSGAAAMSDDQIKKELGY